MSPATNRGRLTLAPIGTTAHLAFAACHDPDLAGRHLIAEIHTDHLRGWLVRNDDGEWCILASAGEKWTERPLVLRKVLAAAQEAGIDLPYRRSPPV